MDAERRDHTRRQRTAGFSVLDYALSVGIDAFSQEHPRIGTSTWAHTPWHTQPVRLLDHIDVEFLQSELDYNRQKEAA